MSVAAPAAIRAACDDLLAAGLPPYAIRAEVCDRLGVHIGTGRRDGTDAKPCPVCTQAGRGAHGTDCPFGP